MINKKTKGISYEAKKNNKSLNSFFDTKEQDEDLVENNEVNEDD
jgi:hypothetical protein